jgi:hypothetical protein
LMTSSLNDRTDLGECWNVAVMAVTSAQLVGVTSSDPDG